MMLATKGGQRVTLDSVVKFVRLARSYNQKEVVEMLADPVVQAAKVVTLTKINPRLVVEDEPIELSCSIMYMYNVRTYT